MDSELRLPVDYQRICESGILHPDDGVRMSQFRWLTCEEIAKFEGPTYLSDRLVPFALSPARDRYGWWRSTDGSGYDYVVLSYNDCDDADVYSSDFTSFLYRMMLDECSDCWFSLQDESTPDAATAIMRRNVEFLRPHLPDSWIRTLSDILVKAPRLSKNEDVVWIDKREAKQIIARDLSFPFLDEQVKQYF
jgi:hypothetical protein